MLVVIYMYGSENSKITGLLLLPGVWDLVVLVNFVLSALFLFIVLPRVWRVSSFSSITMLEYVALAFSFLSVINFFLDLLAGLSNNINN